MANPLETIWRQWPADTENALELEARRQIPSRDEILAAQERISGIITELKIKHPEIIEPIKLSSAVIPPEDIVTGSNTRNFGQMEFLDVLLTKAAGKRYGDTPGKKLIRWDVERELAEKRKRRGRRPGWGKWGRQTRTQMAEEAKRIVLDTGGAALDEMPEQLWKKILNDEK